MVKLPHAPNHTLPPDDFPPDAETIPNRPVTRPIPRFLRAHYDGKTDLAAEFATRYTSLQLLTVAKTPKKGDVATFSTADGLASVSIEALPNGMLWIFTYGSMLSLRFALDELSLAERSRWLERLGHLEDGVTFVWGQRRWERDYLVMISRRQFLNIYAFSINGFEAAVRLTPETRERMLAWLSARWPNHEEQLTPSESAAKFTF